MFSNFTWQKTAAAWLSAESFCPPPPPPPPYIIQYIFNQWPGIAASLRLLSSAEMFHKTWKMFFNLKTVFFAVGSNSRPFRREGPPLPGGGGGPHTVVAPGNFSREIQTFCQMSCTRHLIVI